MNDRLFNSLNQFLSDLLVQWVNLHNFHWNITSPLITNIHEKTKYYYEEIGAMFDEVAERIRVGGKFPITTLDEIMALKKLSNYRSRGYKEDEIISLIKKDFNTLLDTVESINEVATKLDDPNTLDLISEYKKFFDKELLFLTSMK